MHDLDQIGIVLTNFLISFFADAYVMHDLIFIGAVFQALMPSLMNVLGSDICYDSVITATL